MTRTDTYALPLERLRRMHMPMDRANARVEILLVEDSRDDADLMIEALKDGCWDTQVTLVDNGEDALDYLFREGAFTKAIMPDLILLDLYLPRKNGLEVLAALKQDARLRHIPVVIMTSTDNQEDILNAYDRNVNCCVLKPADQEQFAQAVRKIKHFWLRQASRCKLA